MISGPGLPTRFHARPPRRARVALSALFLLAGPATGLQQIQDRAQRPFRHATHDAVECTDCHSARETPGRVRIPSQADCQRCHHSPRLAEPCARCHGEDTQAASLPVAQTLRIGGGAPAARLLLFAHSAHAAFTCAECHGPRAPFTATFVTCVDCHSDHHVPDRDCMACHTPPREGVHERAAHITCTGAGCHDAGRAPAGPPRTRQLCLSCHQDQADHIPGEICVECHVLPRRVGAGHGDAPP